MDKQIIKMNKDIFGENEETLTVKKVAEARMIAKHHKQQASLIKQGWRYVDIAKNLKMFVPCDKDGKPTKEGKEKIEQRLKLLGL